MYLSTDGANSISYSNDTRYQPNQIISTLLLRLMHIWYVAYTLSLLQTCVTLRPQTNLAKISAGWLLEFTNEAVIYLEKIFFKMKWQSISIVCSWKTGLEAMRKVAWLSKISFTEPIFPNFKCCSSYFNHTNSCIESAMFRCFTSALDLVITLRFLLFNEIRFPIIST